MRGFKNIQKYNEENTGLPYKLFQLKKDGDFAVVRILQDPEEWVGLQMHQVFGKLRATRCTSDYAKDPDNCPLCAADVPRSLRTFIPVRVREDEPEDRVQIIEYGAKALQKVLGWMREIDESYDGASITDFDFKVRRSGTKTDTEYTWVLQPKTQAPLSDEENALEAPDIEELIPVLPEDVLIRRAKEFAQAGNVKEVEKPQKSRF